MAHQFMGRFAHNVILLSLYYCFVLADKSKLCSLKDKVTCASQVASEFVVNPAKLSNFCVD